jgi:hypothetical protein
MAGFWHAGAATLKSASSGYTGILLLEAANAECSSTKSHLLEDISVTSPAPRRDHELEDRR